MRTEQQLCWAEALQIQKMHGADALRWIAERIGALALTGDLAGIERLRQIAFCMDELMHGERQ